MKRRLYFLFPDVMQVRSAVEDLKNADIVDARIHAVAKTGRELSALPPTMRRQTTDACCAFENVLWKANLVLFFIATAGLFASLFWGSTGWSVLTAAIMGITFIAGERFAARVPHAHLDEFRDALAHGELLLMVDVTRDRVAELEALVQRKHPGAVVGGVGWSAPALGL